MKKLLLVLFLLPALLLAQNKGTGPSEKPVKEEMRIKKQRKREARERRKLEKEEQKKIKKHHKRIQTKQVQKRMKRSRKTSARVNENKREFFLKRWFTKKPGRAPKKKD